MIKKATLSRQSATALAAALLIVICVHAQDAAPDEAIQSLAVIRAAAQSYVKSLVPAGPAETIVTVGQLDERLRLARCPKKELSASLPAGASVQAHSTVGVSCAAPVHWTVYVPVTVESRIDVLVLTHAVNRESRLTSADVTIEKRTAAGPGSAYLMTVAELSGRTVRRPLPAGTPLSVDMFSPDLIVKRGQEVTLLSAAGSVEVRATGRAMVDGAAGSRIQVQNLTSQRIVEGVVESADLVRVAR
jgi:flagella basal body P-ring formation protein FlgA